MAYWKIEEISKHPSYHGAITTTKAKQRLKGQRKNCYLTRYSEERREFVLSVYEGKENDHETESEVFRNFDISIMKEGNEISYEVSETEKKFKTVAELLEYYKRSHLTPSVKSIGMECVEDSKLLI